MLRVASSLRLARFSAALSVFDAGALVCCDAVPEGAVDGWDITVEDVDSGI